MKKSKSADRKLTIIRVDKRLDKYLDKGLFKDKIEKANHILRIGGLPDFSK